MGGARPSARERGRGGCLGWSGPFEPVGLCGREKEGGKIRKRIWAGLEKKEEERDVCFCFFIKGKRYF